MLHLDHVDLNKQLLTQGRSMQQAHWSMMLQVEYCELRLRQLELSSQQLLQVSADQVSGMLFYTTAHSHGRDTNLRGGFRSAAPALMLLVPNPSSSMVAKQHVISIHTLY